jgi:hypothetical protein
VYVNNLLQFLLCLFPLLLLAKKDITLTRHPFLWPPISVQTCRKNDNMQLLRSVYFLKLSRARVLSRTFQQQLYLDGRYSFTEPVLPLIHLLTLVRYVIQVLVSCVSFWGARRPVAFSVPSGEMTEYYRKIGHDMFVLRHFVFTIPSHPKMPRYLIKCS